MLVSTALLAAALSASSQVTRTDVVQQKPQFSFGVIADVQYADKNPAGGRHYRTSLKRLTECVDDLNRRDLEFVIQLGDFIDAGKDSFEALLPIWRKLRMPRRNVIGNHDLPFLRKNVLHKLDLRRGYYEFTVGSWRYAVLDGMDVSLYGYPKGHAKLEEATKMLAGLRDQKAKNAQTWNGGIGRDQIAWLRSTLKDATRRGQRVILNCHFPILAEASSNEYLLWNHAEILRLIESFPCVAAWFNGHDHAGGYAEKNGIHHVTFSGMVEAPKKNAYGIVDVFTDKLVVRGVGKQKDLELALRPQTEGFVGSNLKLMDLDLPVPDHATLSCRNRTVCAKRHVANGVGLPIEEPAI